jgi:hypothetical protein
LCSCLLDAFYQGCSVILGRKEKSGDCTVNTTCVNVTRQSAKNTLTYSFNENKISKVRKSKEFLSMVDKTIPSLLTLPVELVYRILDQVSNVTLFCSMLNVCTRLDAIIENYHRYQVYFSSSLKQHRRHMSVII